MVELREPRAAPAAPDNAALSRAIQRGDETAFAAFYAAWFAATLALARASSRRDEAFCLDVVQDVMLTVAKSMPALRDERAVRGWMTTTVLRALADRARAERRRQQREAAAGAAAAAAGDEPWVALAAGERQQWLLARVQELPAHDQALLRARFAAGESVAAAGAPFGLSADAAHGRLRRVMERLRQAAAEWWHG